MECKEIIEMYLTSLKEKFAIEPADSGCIIYTPYLDPSNDPISVFVERHGDRYRISDMTQAYEYLFLHGLEIKPESSQKKHLNIILNRLGISFSENELFVVVPKEELADGITHLIDALKTTQDLIFTTKPRKYSDFGEEVASWLRDSGIVFEKKKDYTGASGGIVSVDFVIQTHEEPAFLYALHSESPGYAKDVARRVIVNWIELEKAGYDFYSMCILDDALGEDLWDASFKLLKTHTRKVVFWDDRDKLKEALA